MWWGGKGKERTFLADHVMIWSRWDGWMDVWTTDLVWLVPRLWVGSTDWRRRRVVVVADWSRSLVGIYLVL